jgi:hypothetical protein
MVEDSNTVFACCDQRRSFGRPRAPLQQKTFL